MATRTTAQRLDGVEESMGVMQGDMSALKDEMLNIGKRFDHFLKIHEESG